MSSRDLLLTAGACFVLATLAALGAITLGLMI